MAGWAGRRLQRELIAEGRCSLPRWPQPDQAGARRIDRLVMVVTDACNLRCRYCYARVASSGHLPGRMAADTAREIVRRVLTGRESCNLIQFFGGEPTLNMDAVEAAIAETLALVQNGGLRKRPRFAIVTNGVFLDPGRTLAALARYGIETTVSLDGPASLHDALRPHVTSAPTYDRVART